MSTGLRNLDCFGVTRRVRQFACFSLLNKGNSVVLVNLIAAFLSIILDIAWYISRLAAFGNLFTGVTVPVVLHCGGRSANAEVFSVVSGGTVMLL